MKNSDLQHVTSLSGIKEVPYLSSNSDLLDPLVSNGFRINPISIMCSDNKPRIFCYIRPNKSNRVFFFKDYISALKFASNYSNNHNDSFWFKLWNHSFSMSGVSNF